MSDRDGNVEIYTMGADGSEIRRLTYEQAVDTEPSFAPSSAAPAMHSGAA
jgi:Tol biopolymer transport system component